jgi:hypothetical protein
LAFFGISPVSFIDSLNFFSNLFSILLIFVPFWFKS